MTEAEKKMKKYVTAVERRLNMPMDVKARVMSDFSSSIQARRENGMTDKEIFAFFGATRPDKTGPWNPNAHIYRLETPCSGCLKRNCPLEEPLCHKLDADQIAENIINMENRQ